MWLEELAWLWVPVLGAIGIWMMWSVIVLKTDVRDLRRRLEAMEAEASTRPNTAPQVREH